MSTASVAAPTKNLAVTLIGVLTMVWGAAQAVLGVLLIFFAHALLAVPSPGPVQPDPVGFLPGQGHLIAQTLAAQAVAPTGVPLAPTMHVVTAAGVMEAQAFALGFLAPLFLALLLCLFGAIATVIGVVCLLQGVPGILAGLGVLSRKRWGRFLTSILAVFAILWGLLWLGAYDQGATYVAIGAGHIVYGLLALVILIKYGAEFSRPRVQAN